MQQQPPVLIRGPADLRPGDILLGRGNKHSRWPGNIHFRSLVQERQGEYVSIRGDQGTKSVSNWTKNGIASEIFEAVRAGRTSSLPPSNSAFAGTRSAAVVAELANGRFLRQADAQTLAQAGLPSGTKTADDNGRPRGEYWQEVTTDVALEKIKMSLRQQKKRGKNDADADSCGSDDDSSSSSDDGKKKRKRKAKTKTRKKKNRTAGSSSSAAEEEDGDNRKPAAIPAGIPLQVSIGGASNTGMMGMSPLPGLSVLPGAPTGTNMSGGSSGTNNNGLLLNLLLQRQQQQQRATQQTGLLNLLAQQQSWNSGSAPNNNNNNVAVLAALLQQQQQQQLAEQALALLQQLLRQQQPPSNTNNSNNAAQAFLLQQILQQGQVQGQQQVQLPQLQPQPALAVGGSPNLAAPLPLLQRQQGANNYISAVNFPTATQGTDVTGTNAPQANQQPGLALLAALAGAGTGGSGAPAEASDNDDDDTYVAKV